MQEIIFNIARTITLALRIIYALMLLFLLWALVIPSAIAEFFITIIFIFVASFMKPLDEIRTLTAPYKFHFYGRNLIYVTRELMGWASTSGYIKEPIGTHDYISVIAVARGALISFIPIGLIFAISIKNPSDSPIGTFFGGIISSIILGAIVFFILIAAFYPVYRLSVEQYLE